MQELRKYLSADGTVRIASVVSTDLVNEAFRYLEASPLAKVITGRAITASLLMASQMKEGLSISLNFKGEGPLENIFAAASYDGWARAFCQNRMADLPDGETRIGQGIGKGTLDVTQQQPFEREPHRGTVELVSGEVGEDIAYYLQQSQQIPSIVALVAIPSETGIEVAGGYIVELMPGYTDETIDRIEAVQGMMGSLSERMLQGATASELVDNFLFNFEMQEFTHPHEFQYKCGCSQERVENSVMLLGAETLDEMIKEDEENEVRCEFCGKRYRLDKEDVVRIRKKLSSETLN